MLKKRQKLGKYRIERRIADGPMAAVYAAVDTIHGTKVALKVPHESAMTDFFLADFKREARLAHDAGVHPSDARYVTNAAVR